MYVVTRKQSEEIQHLDCYKTYYRYHFLSREHNIIIVILYSTLHMHTQLKLIIRWALLQRDKLLYLKQILH